MLKIVSLQDEILELTELSEITTAPTWIDATKITAEEAKILQQKFELHPLTTEDLIKPRTRIKMELFPKYSFCVFYSLQKSRQLKTLEVDVILSKNLLITSHIDSIPAITELQLDHKQLQYLLSKGTDFLFYHFLDQAVDSFFPVMDGIDTEIEAAERLIAEGVSSAVLSKITSLRKKVIYLKKITIALREKISLLTKGDYPFISRKVVPYFRDISNNSIRIFETIENYRESVSNLSELYLSTVSNNTNEIMKVLSVIATTALPLTVISGIYGTNFEFLPGASASYGFWIMIALMIVVMSTMLLYFRKRGWF
ncbi:MAG TPA: magnesium/cobalt transporter CorA [Candidatus Nanoarchaeia archaeon]|nr:magnesium/cobalt transporter CorA [Candidatus Nanoarchaeia archaeon]